MTVTIAKHGGEKNAHQSCRSGRAGAFAAQKAFSSAKNQFAIFCFLKKSLSHLVGHAGAAGGVPTQQQRICTRQNGEGEEQPAKPCRERKDFENEIQSLKKKRVLDEPSESFCDSARASPGGGGASSAVAISMAHSATAPPLASSDRATTPPCSQIRRSKSNYIEIKRINEFSEELVAT
eukprot:COSAG04_NODE_788_length_10303_cov_33.536946_10_plen_179_part_00